MDSLSGGEGAVEKLLYLDEASNKRLTHLNEIPFYKYQKRILLENNVLIDASEILDYILYRCDEKLVPLEEELNMLKNYLEIEKIRYSEKLSLNTKLVENVGSFKIVPLILLPFVENAFKHGVSNYPGNAFVKIDVTLVKKNLFFSIENTKNDQVEKEESYAQGIGLINVRKRLDLVYPEKYILKIDKSSEKFSVNLTIELEE